MLMFRVDDNSRDGCIDIFNTLMCTCQTELWVSRWAGNAKYGWEGTGRLSENHRFRSRGRVKSEWVQIQPKGTRQMHDDNSTQKLQIKATLRSYCSSTLGREGLCNGELAFIQRLLRAVPSASQTLVQIVFEPPSTWETEQIDKCERRL